MGGLWRGGGGGGGGGGGAVGWGAARKMARFLGLKNQGTHLLDSEPTLAKGFWTRAFEPTSTGAHRGREE